MDTIILTSKEDLAHYLNRAPPDNIIRISKEFQLLDKKGIRQTSQNSPNKLEALITTSPSVPTYVKEYLKENPNEFMTSNKFNSEHFSQFNELLRISQIKKIPLFDRDIIENIKQKQKKIKLTKNLHSTEPLKSQQKKYQKTSNYEPLKKTTGLKIAKHNLKINYNETNNKYDLQFLHTFISKNQIKEPTYKIEEIFSKNNPQFKCVLEMHYLSKHIIAKGVGTTKQKSKQNAANHCCLKLFELGAFMNSTNIFGKKNSYNNNKNKNNKIDKMNNNFIRPLPTSYIKQEWNLEKTPASLLLEIIQKSNWKKPIFTFKSLQTLFICKVELKNLNLMSISDSKVNKISSKHDASLKMILQLKNLNYI
ncbi:hypothetical protein M0813_26179 [Anaeramoeba flamelloides]|uniref:DRBM domain-containing protein n=1 Tax=Anaeramoeba flamelloides TaxID=1746091 RepID=A0ABQ8Y024_9EUKA|nr:hypothetical protein M0813_26179 [Anaeramoeba flamelloides]